MNRSFTPTWMTNTIMREMKKRHRPCKCAPGVAYDLENLRVSDGVVNTCLRCTVCGYPVETSADLSTGEIGWSVDSEWTTAIKAQVCTEHEDWGHYRKHDPPGCYWGQ